MKKLTVKRMIAAAGAVFSVVAVAVTMGILGNSGVSDALSHSETFTGYLSESCYSTREETALAFVDEQLSGATAAVYADFNILNKLSATQIQELNATNASSARQAAPKVTSGEHCVISYTAAAQPRSVKADILYTEENAFRYFARLPEKGEQPTKAYIDSVFDGNKYLNCTVQSNLSLSQLGAYNTYLQTILLDNDKAYFNQQLPGFINEVYLLESKSRIVPYLKSPIDDDGKFYSIDEINAQLFSEGLQYEIYLTKGGELVNIEKLKGIADVADFAFSMEMDCSYFIKTDYGFSMTADKFKDVCRTLAGDEFTDEFDEFWYDYRVNFRADYYVNEGRLQRVAVVLQMAYENDVFAISVQTDYTGFDATTVNFPWD